MLSWGFNCYCQFCYLSNSLPLYPGNLWFVQAIGCNVKYHNRTEPTINFPGMGQEIQKEAKLTSKLHVIEGGGGQHLVAKQAVEFPQVLASVL